MKRAIWLCLAVGCSSSSSPQTDAPAHDAANDARAVDAAPGSFQLTSTAYTEGGAIPVANSCNGANASPPLAWVNAPVAKSFAIVLTDKSNNLVHAAIVDIPGSATSVPAGIDKVFAPTAVPGAHQALAYDGTTHGYLGPCPPNTHTYEQAIYALDTSALPGVTSATTKDQALALAMQHALGKATLTATFTP